MNLIDKLPYFYNNGIVKPLIDAEQIERDILFEEIQDTLNQCFVETSTWGLDYWERLLFITNTQGRTYEERRSIIYTKLRGTATTTVQVVEQLAKSFFQSERTTVTEHNENYMFEIEFENPVLDSTSLKDLHDALEIYKPAHLNYCFTFTNKGISIITTNMDSGYCWLPICNVTHVGTWWREYADGLGITSQLPKAASYHGYSALVVCGIYKNKQKISRQEDPTYMDSNVVGTAIVGKAKVG